MDVKLASRLQQFGADPDVAARAAALSPPVVMLAADTALQTQASPPVHLHLMLDGWAHQWRDLRDGRRQTVALILPGEFVDADLLARNEQDVCTSALTPCRVARLPLEPFQLLVDKEPSLRTALLRVSARDKRIATQWMVSLGRRSALERIAHLLCEVAVRLNGPPRSEAVSFPFPMTQSDLADATGLSVVHVNRSLQTLRREVGLVVEKRRATISCWAQMSVLAEFSSDYLAADAVDAVHGCEERVEHDAVRRLAGE